MKPLPGIRSSGLYISLLAAFVVFVPGSRATPDGVLEVHSLNGKLHMEIEQRLRPTLLDRTTGGQELILVRDVVNLLQW